VPIPITIRPRRFWIATILAMAITASYPIGLWLIVKSDAWISILKNEVTWSVYSLFLIPIGFGLMVSVFDADVFRRIHRAVTVLFGVVFAIGVVALFFAVRGDTRGVLTPDRISSSLGGTRNFQSEAISIDSCLRAGSTCTNYAALIAAVPQCRNRFANEYPNELRIDPTGLRPETLARWYEGATKRHAYFCALLNTAEQAGTELPRSAMVYIAQTLNFLLVLFIWCFIWLSHIYFAYVRRDLGDQALNVLVGCFVILVTWFPFRTYSEWYLWYGDLTHIWNYPPYWGLLLFAFELLLLYAIWVITRLSRITLLAAIPSVYGVVATVVGVIAAIKPALLELVFTLFSRLPGALYVILLCGVVLAMAVYSRALLRQSN